MLILESIALLQIDLQCVIVGTVQATASCGSITMNGGFIQKAKGGDRAAGIGCGNGSKASCEAITINGGQIGGDYDGYYYDGAIAGTNAASIGCGNSSLSTCGTITIGTGITSVVVYWGNDRSQNYIGPSNRIRTICDVFFGGVKAFDKARHYWYDGIDAYNSTLPKSCGGINVGRGEDCLVLTPDTP